MTFFVLLDSDCDSIRFYFFVFTFSVFPILSSILSSSVSSFLVLLIVCVLIFSFHYLFHLVFSSSFGDCLLRVCFYYFLSIDFLSKLY